MAVIQDHSSSFCDFLADHKQNIWDRIVAQLTPLMDPVDQTATRIWFSFWPLRLSQALREWEDPAQAAKDPELDGNFRLEGQLTQSVRFLFGSRCWPAVKEAVLDDTREGKKPDEVPLKQHILSVAEKLADTEKVPSSVLLGITAVAFMALRQTGMEAFAEASDFSRKGSSVPLTLEEVWKRRNQKPRRSWLHRLAGKPVEHTVTFDERKAGSTFQALPGQDLSMASAREEEHPAEDPRCIAGPIPAQCRSGACGYCWVGVLHGRENLSGISEFERKRLNYFGYASSTSHEESHPVIRLACQSKCYGNVSVVIPPWNGQLNERES